MHPMLTRLVFLVLIVGSGTALYTVAELPLRQAQDNAASRFGAETLALCRTATKARTGSFPNKIKVGVINSDKRTVYDVYEAALPSALKATDKSDMTVVLCLTENQSVYDTNEYGTPTKYTCTRYTRDLLGYLVDVKTGKTIDYYQFDGQLPPECPDETDSNVTRTGDIPRVSDITDWFARIIKGYSA